MCYTQSRFNALLSACVMSLIATAGWSQSLTWLGVLPDGLHSYAYDVSADGAVVVGRAYNAAGQWRAFRWTELGGMQVLGTLGGGNSYANDVSADGAVVVGRASNAAGQEHAFRWTASGGMQDLGTLPGYDRSYAYDVSADGSVVVGWAENAAWQRRAFRWTASGGMQDLGTLGGTVNTAHDVSADGAVVVGESGWRAFRWTQLGGMEDLNTTYASLLTNGSVLGLARAISPNGRYIVGEGYNAATGRGEAFLLDAPYTPPCNPPDGDVNGDGIVDDADLLIVLFNFGNRCR
jgi:probable HAF family extracellular repeat protein